MTPRHGSDALIIDAGRGMCHAPSEKDSAPSAAMWAQPPFLSGPDCDVTSHRAYCFKDGREGWRKRCALLTLFGKGGRDPAEDITGEGATRRFSHIRMPILFPMLTLRLPEARSEAERSTLEGRRPQVPKDKTDERKSQCGTDFSQKKVSDENPSHKRSRTGCPDEDMGGGSPSHRGRQVPTDKTDQRSN